YAGVTFAPKRSLRSQARPVEPFRGQGEYLASRGGNADRMLILRGERAVAGHGGPAVRKHLHMRLSEIDHRLDREDHALAHFHAFAGASIVEVVTRIVKNLPHAVAAKVAHDRAALAFGIGLYGGTDRAGARPRFHRRDAQHEAFISHFEQAFGGALYLAHRIHAARIPVPAIKDVGDVDIDDLPFPERLVV